MRIDKISSGTRKAVNLTLDTGVVEAARANGLNLSKVCEAALRQATKKAAEESWKEENREAMEAWNVWIEQNGLPLEKYRMF
ncbi:MAG: type II toxin-antitoxin system CcdA family antitoxin [Sphingomonas sp.]|uniref:type II toxin-antitoxin system CcdA family antitoxin n=1 Tax=Sphingomonas sp. TaxID=28214 RepID=UPI000A0C3795|nr:type II toxin-antitoxin system CcdA family antitoxin [Sphingomonas sp.]OQW72441.1 MAG: post-segregation antitoxin CcdA [Proteobacteria bacterium ST_bin13]